MMDRCREHYLVQNLTKVKAAEEMPNPEDVAGVGRFLGFGNYLRKFLPSLSDKCEPLRKLT